MDLHYGSKGEAVKTLQRRLNNNHFHDHHLGIDGQFGARTAAAVHETKWYMGYPAGKCQPIAGAVFESIITNKLPLTATQRKRRAERLVVPPVDPWKEKRHNALERAKADLGLAEGYNNDIKYNRWWTGGPNDGAPYCVRALSYWWDPYCSAVVRGVRWQGTDSLLEDAKAGRYGVRLTSSPVAGDLGVTDLDGHSNPDHGFMVVNDEGYYVDTIEANHIYKVVRYQRADDHSWYIRIVK